MRDMYLMDPIKYSVKRSIDSPIAIETQLRSVSWRNLSLVVSLFPSFFLSFFTTIIKI